MAKNISASDGGVLIELNPQPSQIQCRNFDLFQGHDLENEFKAVLRPQILEKRQTAAFYLIYQITGVTLHGLTW